MDNTFYEYFKKLEEANAILKRHIGPTDYEQIVKSYQDKKFVAVFIDVDYARAINSNKIRGQLYEAAELYQKQGGCVYALSSKPRSYFDEGHYNAFNEVFCGPDVTKEDKINFLLNHYYWSKEEYDIYVFGEETFCKELEEKAGNHRYIGISVTGTTFLSLYEGHSPAINYTLVEYLLFFLATKFYLKHREQVFFDI